MNQQKSKNFQCNNIFELLLINKNYLFFHNTHKIRRPHKVNLDMAGKILTWRENSAASQSKRAWNAPWNAPSPPRIFSCRHDNVMTTRDNNSTSGSWFSYIGNKLCYFHRHSVEQQGSSTNSCGKNCSANCRSDFLQVNRFLPGTWDMGIFPVCGSLLHDSSNTRSRMCEGMI